jgi:integrase
LSRARFGGSLRAALAQAEATGASLSRKASTLTQVVAVFAPPDEADPGRNHSQIRRISMSPTAAATVAKKPQIGTVEDHRSAEILAFGPAANEAPMFVNGIVPPRRRRNSDRRPREYLTPAEVGILLDSARRRGRYGHRDATMILLTYRHGLRVGELVSLQWDQVDLSQGLLHVTRLKRGVPSVHPLSGVELRALRRVRREQGDGRHLFQTERKSPMSAAGFRKTLARIGEASELAFPVHPHMLRHACGFKLANDGQDTRAVQHYLGHRNIQHTVRYTELVAARFNGFWKD